MKTKFQIAILALLILSLAFSSCGPKKEVISLPDEPAKHSVENDTVSIKSDKVEYEIIIIEPGFNAWLYGTARPQGYYDQQFLENRNRLYVMEWNLRVIQPLSYDPNLYVLRIDYDPSIDYGYELNYKLFNYFIYFQLKYKQQLTAIVPRI